MERHARLFGPAVTAKLTERAREMLRVDARRSLRLAETSLAMARHGGEARAIALALRANANALWFLNRNQAAVEVYGEAIELFERVGDRSEVGRTLSSSLQPLIRLGEYGRAMEAAKRARAIFEESADGLRLARLNLNVANILHRQDRFQEAFDAYERVYRELAEFRDAEGIAAALHNMAVCLIVLNDFHKALEVYGSVRDFCLAHAMPALAAQADYNIAYLYFFRGDYRRALEMLRDARIAAEKVGDQYHRALCFMDSSEIYIELNLHEEAAETAQEAFAGFQSLQMGYESAKSLANRAIAEGRMGQVRGSLELFAQARDLFVKEGNPVWPSLLDLYQAMVLEHAGRLGEARWLCRAALKFFRDHKITGREVLCRLLLARIALLTDGRGAETQLRAAMRLLKDFEAPQLRQQAYLLMGQLAESDGNIDRARRYYLEALEQAESLRMLLRADELKIGFTQGTQDIYAALVRLAKNAEEALEFIEQAKSRSLRDLVAGHVAYRSPSGEFSALKEELNWYYHRLEMEQSGSELPKAERVAALESEIADREKKLGALLRDMPMTDAESAAALPVAEIRAGLEPGTTIVEYFRVGEELLAVVVSRDRLVVVPLAPAARVEHIAQLLWFQFSKFQLGEEYVAACHDILLESTQGHLRSLYEELIAPLEEHLHAPKLVLAPHGTLHNLPLHAAFDGERYLIDRFRVSYAPSAGVYTLCRQRAPIANRPPLVMGIPDARAPMIAEEVRAVAEILPGAQVFLGGEATREVLEKRGAGAGVVHIATHGRFRSDRPMFSSIRLGDGYLTLLDLYQLSLPVELAALSGCSTGRSAVAGGDELLGLVRGLLQAGARTLLLTLWDVQDQSTAEFMRSFYGRLSRRGDAAEALRGAMLELRRTHPHPYYWAPFTLVGKA